ncbi:MAG TPA: phage tail tube protein [Kofleriaceae bacterium]|nr:phage tail tube protein [Kofleriaceae bacterium]
MSSFPVVKAESVSLLAALESTLGVQPTSGWQTLEPNADGISEFYPKLTKVSPSPLTKLRQKNASAIVDLSASPKLTLDLTKDHTDRFIEGAMLAKAKHSGGTGLAYFTPTARTTTDYTVAASGALQAGTLMLARGFVNAANNGLFQVGASSTATAIKVSGGVAETVSGYVATLEVAGFRGASGDIQIDVNGDIISTVADFTTMGLTVGQWLWVGGTIGGGHDFATAAYRGFAKIKGPITATKIPLARRAWTVGSADTGTGKTIDLYWGRWLRTVAFTDADYQEPTYNIELSYLKLSAGTTDEYVYAAGNLIDEMQVTSPAQNLVTMDLSFVGTTIGDPTVTRATGASTAAASLAIARYNTVNQQPYLRLVKQSDETTVSDDIETWSMTLKNNVTPQKQQGTLGTKRDVVGKAEVDLTASVFLTQDDALKACSNNTALSFGAGFSNDDGGIFFDLPSVNCDNSPPKFPANGPVSLNLQLSAFRDATGNYTIGVSLFPYLPSA